MESVRWSCHKTPCRVVEKEHETKRNKNKRGGGILRRYTLEPQHCMLRFGRGSGADSTSECLETDLAD